MTRVLNVSENKIDQWQLSIHPKNEINLLIDTCLFFKYMVLNFHNNTFSYMILNYANWILNDKTKHYFYNIFLRLKEKEVIHKMYIARDAIFVLSIYM